ncbi:hypothetical protein [Rhodococcus sp. T7]|uniref:hypothetical protein n=1 Tax=Rhodococcus sp. T7 TaxID=627444 RepID=UPI00135CD5B1|nr:hypothetical protein [Rhodococcus sp. T7]KAF0958459.1 hypothetical protein MLGJGCBP_08438 [Rhodococcus sp. T7]
MSTKYGPLIEPQFFDDDRVLQMQDDDTGRSVLLMLLEFRAYSMSALTDGFIPAHALRRATLHHDPHTALARLESVGLALPSERDGRPGWQIDWSSQRSAEKIKDEAARHKAWDSHKTGNHSLCDPYRNFNCHKNGDLKTWQTEHPHGIRTESASDPSVYSTHQTQSNPRSEVGGSESDEGATAPDAAGGVTDASALKVGSAPDWLRKIDGMII